MTRMEMKKNGSMRAASALMVATLLTTGVLSGTYAKYTTQRSGSDAARVAKWGVVLQVDGSLYGDKYGKGTNIPSDEKTGISVKTEQTTNADAVKNAVAPGTRCAEGLKFSMNGSPEVSTRLIATLKAQNVYLKKGTYALMVKASSVTEKNWKADTYYTKNESVYTLQESYASGDSYMMLDKVTLDADYYPVVYKSARRNNGDTKSDSLNASYRCYPIPQPLLEKLKQIKFQKEINQKIYGEEYFQSDYIFTWEDGHLYTPDYLTKSFKKIVRRNPNLDDSLTLHSLRASCVSILIHEGIDIKDVQEWVGHKDIQTTLNIYARINEKEKQKVNQKMLECVFKDV